MVSPELVRGYSLALLSIASDDKKIEKYKTDSKAIYDAILENPGFIKLLIPQSLTHEEKIGILKRAFSKVEKNILNFMELAVTKDQAHVIEPVLKKFISYVNENLKIREGVVYSYAPLSKDEIKRIEKKVKSIVHIQAELTNKIDKDLLSGIKVVVDDMIIEDTILSRLEHLKQDLLKGVR